MKPVKAQITGTGMYAPEKVLTNVDLEKIVDTNDEWITSRTGIKRRHIAADDETTSTMAAEAGRQAIENAGLKPEDIDLVLVASLSPDMMFPATACLVQDKLKLPNAGTVDVSAACSGFVYSFSMAAGLIGIGLYKNILVIGSEVMSRFIDWTDRNTCVLFGDGAGAVVLSAVPGDSPSEVIDIILGGDGSGGDQLTLPAGGSKNPATHETVDQKLHYLKMNGNGVFKVAVRSMTDITQKLIDRNNVPVEKVKLVVPHQANFRINDAVRERLHMTEAQMFNNIFEYANTSGATIPIGIADAVKQGLLKRGDYVVMVAFGGGFTWGAVLLKW